MRHNVPGLGKHPRHRERGSAEEALHVDLSPDCESALRNIVERAFELARAGECRNPRELEQRLKWEGYEAVAAHLDSASLRKQLRALFDAHQQAIEADPSNPLPRAT